MDRRDKNIALNSFGYKPRSQWYWRWQRYKRLLHLIALGAVLVTSTVACYSQSHIERSFSRSAMLALLCFPESTEEHPILQASCMVTNTIFEVANVVIEELANTGE